MPLATRLFSDSLKHGQAQLETPEGAWIDVATT